LLEIAVGDDVEKDETAIGILGPPAGIVHGALAFGCSVNHRHEFAAMALEP
jgi:hypothetical protein